MILSGGFAGAVRLAGRSVAAGGCLLWLYLAAAGRGGGRIGRLSTAEAPLPRIRLLTVTPQTRMFRKGIVGIRC